MELEHGIVIGDEFLDVKTGVPSQVGNIMISKSGKLLLAYREGDSKDIKHQEMGEFLKGKTHMKLLDSFRSMLSTAE